MDWIYICWPFVFVIALICAVLFVLCVYVKLAVWLCLWAIRKVVEWLA